MSSRARRKPSLSDSGPPMSPLPLSAQDTGTGQSVGDWWKVALIGLIVLYLIFAGIHASLAPIGETGFQNAPDEAAHIVYIRSLATGHLPTRDLMAGNPHGYEWHQPPLYYLLASLFLPLGEPGVRVVSILCGVGCILLTFRAVQLFFPKAPHQAILAAGIAALTPAHIAITSTVNNDSLLELCFGGALIVLLGALKGGFTIARAVLLGGIISAAILTKATGVLLLPVFLVGLVLLWRSGEQPRPLLRSALWTLLIISTLCGWWFVRNHQLYGEWLPLKVFKHDFRGTATAEDVMSGKLGFPPMDRIGYLSLVGQWTFQSFWAVYGVGRSAREYGVPKFLDVQVYLLLAFACIGMVVGLGRLHFRRKTDFSDTERYALYLLFCTLGLVSCAFFAFILQFFQTQGRYLYPAMLPICFIGSLGWRAIFPPRYFPLASGILLFLLGALTIVFLCKV